MANNCVTLDATGVQAYSSNVMNVTIQPNPFSNSAVLNFDNATNAAYTLELSDLNGNIIRTYTVNSGSVTINRAELAAGVYVYRLTGGKTTQSGKFIIQ